MESKAILRPDDIKALAVAVLNDANRFGVFIAEDEQGAAQGIIVLHRTRDNEQHGLIEMAWLDNQHHTDDALLEQVKKAAEKWAKANSVRTMGALTMRDTPAMARMMASLGFHKTSLVYYGRQVAEVAK
jgi:hypothetical protein